jgi:hypothetical protein
LLFSCLIVSILGIILVSQSLRQENARDYEAELVSEIAGQLSAPEEKSQAAAAQSASAGHEAKSAARLALVDTNVLSGNLDFLSHPEPVHINHILELYRKPEAKECVLAFFAGICGSREIAEIILANADTFEISPALAFALSWEESRFDPKAVNNANRNGSVDRGLFQLNNRSFPHLETSDFYNPQVNAFNAMKHLRSCIKTGGTEIGALAVYNAGIGRVNRQGAPWVTIDYISRIEGNIERIESHFREWESCFLAPAKPAHPDIVVIDIVIDEHPHHHLPIPKLLSAHKR